MFMTFAEACYIIIMWLGGLTAWAIIKGLSDD